MIGLGVRTNKLRAESGGGGAVAPVNVTPPSIPTTLVVGTSFAIDAGTWSNSPTNYNYKLYRGATLIDEQNSASTTVNYTPVQDDAGNTSNIKCVVTATNSAGSASADSNTVSQVLTVRTDSYLTLNSISDATLRGAINNVDIGIINNSLTNLRGLYFFNAGTADKAKYNFLDQRDLDAAFRITFVNTVSGDFTSNGWLPNGVSSYGNTHFTPSTDASVNGMGHGVYSRTNSTTGTRVYGCVFGGATIVQHNLSGGNFVNGNVSNNIINYTASPTTRFLYNRRNSSTDMEVYRDGTSLGTNTNTCAALPSSKFYFGARNGGSGTPDFYDNHQVTIGVLDVGLTNAQALTLRTIVDNYNLECGINV